MCVCVCSVRFGFVAAMRQLLGLTNQCAARLVLSVSPRSVSKLCGVLAIFQPLVTSMFIGMVVSTIWRIYRWSGTFKRTKLEPTSFFTNVRLRVGCAERRQEEPFLLRVMTYGALATRGL